MDWIRQCVVYKNVSGQGDKTPLIFPIFKKVVDVQNYLVGEKKHHLLVLWKKNPTTVGYKREEKHLQTFFRSFQVLLLECFQKFVAILYFVDVNAFSQSTFLTRLIWRNFRKSVLDSKCFFPKYIFNFTSSFPPSICSMAFLVQCQSLLYIQCLKCSSSKELIVY